MVPETAYKCSCAETGSRRSARDLRDPDHSTALLAAAQPTRQAMRQRPHLPSQHCTRQAAVFLWVGLRPLNVSRQQLTPPDVFVGRPLIP